MSLNELLEGNKSVQVSKAMMCYEINALIAVLWSLLPNIGVPGGGTLSSHEHAICLLSALPSPLRGELPAHWWDPSEGIGRPASQ
jgi:hypothetical protein